MSQDKVLTQGGGEGCSYVDSLDWIKKKKAIINPKNTDDKCFQYAVTVASSYGEIKWNPERISNIKPFINKYNWKGTNYSSKTDDWKTFEKNNLTIYLNILYVKENDICPAFQLIFQKINQPLKNK